MRYWRLISIVVVIGVVIGTFYIQSAVATHQYPAFALKKQSGDEKEAEGLMLYGEYRKGNQNDVQEQNEVQERNGVQISEAGSKEYPEQTYFKRLAEIDDSPYIKKLQQHYKHFMREKDSDRTLFDESKTMLAYVNVGLNSRNGSDNDHTFDIDMLEKESGDRQSFQVTLPNDDYSQIVVESVRFHDGELAVFTQNYKRDSENGELHVYRFNIADEKLIQEEPILSGRQEGEESWSDATIINSNDAVDNSNDIIFEVDHYASLGEEGIYTEVRDAELVVYNLVTNELEEVNLPEEIADEIGTVKLHDNKLFFEKQTKNSVDIFTYDIESQKITDKYTMKISNTTDPDENSAVSWNVGNNKLYVSGALKDNNSLADTAIVDLDSHETLYEGIIEAKNKKAAAANGYLTINSVSIK